MRGVWLKNKTAFEGTDWEWGVDEVSIAKAGSLKDFLDAISVNAVNVFLDDVFKGDGYPVVPTFTDANCDVLPAGVMGITLGEGLCFSDDSNMLLFSLAEAVDEVCDDYCEPEQMDVLIGSFEIYLAKLKSARARNAAGENA